MKSWVTSKLLWDPSRDDKALVQDFIWGHYGPAAPAMAEYEELRNGLRTNVRRRNGNRPPAAFTIAMDVPFYTKDFIDKATSIFARAKQLAAGDEQILRRVERAELPILYVKCWRGPKFAGPTYGDDVAEFERIASARGRASSFRRARQFRFRAGRVETENSEVAAKEIVTLVARPLQAQKLGRREPVQLAGAGVDIGFEVDCRDGAFGEADAGVAVADQCGGEPFDIGTVADPAETFVVLCMFKRPLQKRLQLGAGRQGVEFVDRLDCWQRGWR